MSELTLEHIYKRFGDVVAVNDLNIKIQDEEFLVLVGPSGCGKTTALRMIAGLDEITAGDIFIGDRRVNDVQSKDRDIAMVFQNYALYPHMSVYDNMAFGLKLRRTPRAEIDRRVKDVAERLGLTQLLQRKPKQLSGGQRQRVALGRAIVREPQVFLMDEPLSNLDAQLRVQTRADLIRLHQRLATTTVYVTHDQVEAMTMGDRIAIMKEGLLQQLDTPQRVYDHPANTFVASFIGSPSMNFFPGELALEEDDSLWVRCDGIHLKLRFQLADRFAAMNGREVIMGVRPDAILHPLAAGPGDSTGRTVDVHVDVIEPLGSEVYVYLTTGGAEPFVARMDAQHAPRPGEKMQVVFKTEKLHFFDPATERALV